MTCSRRRSRREALQSPALTTWNYKTSVRVRNSLCDPSKVGGGSDPTNSEHLCGPGPHTWPGICHWSLSTSLRCAAVGNHTRCSLFAPSCLTFCSSSWSLGNGSITPTTGHRLSVCCLLRARDGSIYIQNHFTLACFYLSLLGLLQLWLISLSSFNILIFTRLLV